MLQFNKIILHNFGSYSHAKVNLQSKGFCLVSGTNNYVKDNALSNGSGKSFLWNGICWALTGETIHGLRTNLKNINIEEDSCYVTLDFCSDADHYVITRYIAPKSDLKIYKNDTDVSGKGIRESEVKLSQLLPDISRELLASTIIIGQGMPNKFSSYNPSGRKEMLENLTKSNYMIEDIKTRVNNRLNALSTQVTEHANAILTGNTQVTMLNRELTSLQEELTKAIKPNFDDLIEASTSKINALQADVEKLNGTIVQKEKELETANALYLQVTQEKADMLTTLAQQYSELYNEKSQIKIQAEVKVKSLTNEIKRLKSITDVCPHCGRPYDGVHKPDTSAQEAELVIAQEELTTAKTELDRIVQKNAENTQKVNDHFDSKIEEAKQAVNELKKQLTALRTDLLTSTNQLTNENNTLNTTLTSKQNWDTYYENLNKKITTKSQEINSVENNVKLLETSKLTLDAHLAVVKKMEGLVKRDLRGYLLTNIIALLNDKAKQYSETVFGTRDLNLALDKNNLDITYCGKMFDNLSGGEKQRVDLILQFAIRDMLNAYLNQGSNIIVLDEITDFLDKQSCGAVMKLLEKELNNVESVFVISHHAEELELPVDSELKIVKNEDGISEVF